MITTLCAVALLAVAVFVLAGCIATAALWNQLAFLACGELRAGGWFLRHAGL